MTMPRKIKIEFGDAFPYGVYAVSDVTPVRDFDKSTRERAIQAVDEETGLLLWSVDVMDGDPEARKTQRQVTVKIPAEVQPVLPENKTGLPFNPVAFEGLTATPYVNQSGNRPSLAWSFRAQKVIAPKAPVRNNGDKAA